MTAKSLTHKFVNSQADGADATITRPSNWNDDHNFWLGQRTYITTATDTIANSDHLSYVYYNVASNQVTNLAAPTGGNMPLGWTTKIKNVGAGVITLTGTGGATFNGSSSAIPIYQGDAAEIFSLGTGDYIVLVFRAAALAGNGNGGILRYSSTTALTFKPFNGGYTKLNKILRPIPATGITGLASTGVYVNGVAGQNLAANTTYLVFLFDNAGVLTADFCTAGAANHGPSQISGNEGVEVKFASGVEDATRSLIGLIRTDASSHFFDDGVSNFGVATWPNRRMRVFPGVGTGTISGIGATSATELAAGTARLSFVSWADEDPQLWMHGIATANDTTNTAFAAIGLNGVATLTGTTSRSTKAGSGNFTPIMAQSGGSRWTTGGSWNADGFNIVCNAGWVTGGSGSINMTIGGQAMI